MAERHKGNGKASSLPQVTSTTFLSYNSSCVHGILVIAQIVTDVGQYLDESDANVRHMRLLPVRDGQSKPVKNKLAETLVIFGELVDLRPNASRGWQLIQRG